jgi:DNA-binding transcriptional LysR family regulator
VAEVRSLTKASKALHLSQPAVSKHIKLLEEELHGPLFVRSSTEAIKRMVAAGAGIGYVSRLSVKQELASGQLVEIHCAKLQMKRSFSVLIPQGPDPIGIVQAFSKFISSAVGERRLARGNRYSKSHPRIASVSFNFSRAPQECSRRSEATS